MIAAGLIDRVRFNAIRGCRRNGMTRAMRHTSDTNRHMTASGLCAARIWAVTLLLGGLCSCSSSRELSGVDPFQREGSLAAATAASTPISTSTGLSATAGQDGSIERVAYFDASEDSGVQTAGRQDTAIPNRSDRHVPATASGETADLRPSAPTAQRPSASTAQFTPAERRIPVSAGEGVQQTGGEIVKASHGKGPFGAHGPPPDEYLFDGGDRGFPIHYDPYSRHGLETEDTIAEYRDHLGRDHVKSSNRVAIYSPRFGAVRTVSGPQSGVSVDRLALTEDGARAVGMRNQASTLHHSQRESSEGVLVRSRASGLEVGEGEITFEQQQYVTEHNKLLNAFQGIRYGNFDQLLQTDKAQLAYRIEAAVVWTRDQFPVITAGMRAGQEVQARFKVQELIGAEDERRVPGRLQIVKLADRKIAAQGEVVTFTIRYDNLGDRELTEVRIVDNLTPRLEYLADSAESDRPGRFFVDDNHEGSVILRFELDEELPGHAGGTISFQARVR